MKFEAYSIAPLIKKNLQQLGYKRPTDIQYRSIPPILRGEDVLAIAQTGTGKTAAFAIPIIDTLNRWKNRGGSEGVSCIVMVPTHELAIQIAEVFEGLAKGLPVKTYCIIGGVDQSPQVERIEKGVDILVGTPGRLFDLVCKGVLQLKTVSILVLDEADHMLDLGFIKDIQDFTRFLPRKRQTLFFSATINERIKSLAYSLVSHPIRIHISPNDPVSKNITHSVAFIAMDDKRFFLERLINENPDCKVLVFVRTKVRAERVMAALKRVGIDSHTIHSDKEQADRKQLMEQFKQGEIKILVATDVSARGLDIPNVDYVVNYDLPEQPENYVHRVGRTGRGVQKGHAVSFCSPEEKELLSEIEGYLGKPITILDISKKDYTETLDFTNDVNYDWKSLIKEHARAEIERMEKKGKRKKK